MDSELFQRGAVMKNHEFTSKWICADMNIEDRFAPVFRKEFSLPENTENVKVYICGLGMFEMRINGILPDDTLLNPAHTQYSRTVLYREFDITQLCKNTNEITVELGNGFFNENGGVWYWQTASWRSIPVLMCEIVITENDGKIQKIGTDESWLVTKDGPVTVNGIYQGEIYDARKTEDKFTWQNAVAAVKPEGQLKKQNQPFIRRINTMKPENIKRLCDGSYVVTAPEMTTGNIALNINEPYGTEIEIRYGESLKSDGSVVKIGKNEGRDGNWWPDYYIQTDKFISGGKPFLFEPKFSYKGFKYVQISGMTRELKAEDVTIYRIANDVELYSSFECSDKLINSLHALMKRTMLNNFQWKPTDTPVWEKNGWLGDASCGLNSMLYNFNMNAYLESFVDIMADCFDEFGNVPVMVPSAQWGVDNSPVWNTVFVFAVKALCDFYSRTDYAKKLYPQMKEFALKDIKEISEYGWVWKTRNLADWHAPMNENSGNIVPGASEGAEICGTAYIYKMLVTMQEIAEMLGETEDVSEYKTAADTIYNAFNEKLYNEEKGIYETSVWNEAGKRDASYRQTSNLVPLAFGLVPESRRQRVIENLIDNIRQRNHHLDTGCVGTQFILPVLIDNGFVSDAMKILTQTSYPSWGYWIAYGDDTAWEGWEDAVRSRNHYFLGTYEESLFSEIAGICDVKNGFETFTVKPCLDCGLEYMKFSLRYKNGLIRCEWKTDKDGNVTVTAEIPAGCTAHVVFEKDGECKDFIAHGGIYTHTFNVS